MNDADRMPTEGPDSPVSLKKNMLYNTIGSLTYQGCLWVVTVLVVVLSNGYGYSGILSYAMAIGNMFVPIATFSLRSYQVSDVRGTYTQANYVGFRLITIVLAFAIILPYTFIVTDDMRNVAPVLLFLLFKTGESFCDVLNAVEQRAERMDYIGISQFLRGVFLVLGFSTGLVVFGSLEAAIAGMAVPCLLVTVFYDHLHAVRFAALKPHISQDKVRSLARACLPIVLSSLFLGMVVSVARQYYGNTFGMEKLGIYSAIATPAVLIQAGARYLYGPALVPLAKRWQESPDDSFSPFLKKSLVLLALGAAVLVVVFSVFGKQLLTLVYGQEIAPYTPLFPWVLISTAVTAVMWFLNDVLTICRDMRGMLIANTASLALSLVLLIPLESAFGMDGINYLVIAATLFGIVLNSVFLKKDIAGAAEGSHGLE